MTAIAVGRQTRIKPPLAVLVWTVATVSMAGFVAAWILAARNRDLFDVSATFGPDRYLLAFPVVGAVLASRRQSNPIGWFLLAIGLTEAARALAGEYALRALAGPSHAAAVWAAWYVGWSLTLVFPAGLLAFLLLLFPDGRPPTSRWWVLAWFAAGLSAVYLVITWLDPGRVNFGNGLPSVPNPTGVQGAIHILRNSALGVGAWILGFLCLLLAAASVVVRYRLTSSQYVTD
jgi:two-component system, NarL family, sensor kinase